MAETEEQVLLTELLHADDARGPGDVIGADLFS